MQYFYHTARGVAALNKGDDKPLKRLGKFKTEKDAREACERHHAKACRMARAANRSEPEAFYL
tara:strand:- start:212 stop:400 length:189 start_codon:yes stop_codon:yes gene_type:complete